MSHHSGSLREFFSLLRSKQSVSDRSYSLENTPCHNNTFLESTREKRCVLCRGGSRHAHPQIDQTSTSRTTNETEIAARSDATAEESQKTQLSQRTQQQSWLKVSYSDLFSNCFNLPVVFKLEVNLIGELGNSLKLAKRLKKYTHIFSDTIYIYLFPRILF